MDPLSVEGYLIGLTRELVSIHDEGAARLAEGERQGLESVPWAYYAETVRSNLRVITHTQSLCTALMGYVAWVAVEDDERDQRIRLLHGENERLTAAVEEMDRRLCVLQPRASWWVRLRLRVSRWVAP